MSVLIKGMDKETAVRICAYAGVRMDDSDFIPVPPHGRLIDADALLQRAISHGWSTPKWVSDIVIEDAPTIIPAEEEEK